MSDSDQLPAAASAEPEFVQAEQVARVIALDAGRQQAEGEDEDEDVAEVKAANGEHGGEDATADEHESGDDGDDDDSVQGFFSHSSSVFCVSMHGDLVLSGDGDDAAFVWSASSGEEVAKLTGHTDSVTSCSFSADGQYAATGSMDGSVRVWRCADWSQHLHLEGCSADVEWLSFHPSGAALVCGSADCSLWLWSLQSGACLHVLSGHQASVLCGQWTADGKTIVSGDEAGDVCVWSPKTGSVQHRFRAAHAGGCTAIACHPVQRVAMTGGIDGVCCLLNVDNGRLLCRLSGHSESVEAVAFCPSASHQQLAGSISVDGSLRVWDLSTQQVRVSCQHPEPVTGLQWETQAAIVYTACMDGGIRAWDALTGQLLQHWMAMHAPALCLAVAAPSAGSGLRRIVAGGDDGSCLVFAFDVRTREKQRQQQQQHTSATAVSSVADAAAMSTTEATG